MKKWIAAGFILFLLAGPSWGEQTDSGGANVPSGQKQMETDKEVSKRSEQVAPIDGGKLTGQVVGVNPSEGTLEIKTVDGGVSKIKVEDNIKGQLKEIKKGDHIEAKITIRAMELNQKPAG